MSKVGVAQPPQFLSWEGSSPNFPPQHLTSRVPELRTYIHITITTIARGGIVRPSPSFYRLRLILLSKQHVLFITFCKATIFIITRVGRPAKC